MIDYLKEIDDLLIKMFKNHELLLIKSNLSYHSSESSEMDNKTSCQRKIIISNLKWHSSTVRLLINIIILLRTLININHISFFAL